MTGDEDLRTMLPQPPPPAPKPREVAIAAALARFAGAPATANRPSAEPVGWWKK
ncbi:MAG: hypothetical protein HC788_08045, partial [Sphingopyxis sp.]|nr:hypothetical protein [Sphingopyxis sp.]